MWSPVCDVFKDIPEWIELEEEREHSMTNEEWLKSLSTRELAAWLDKFSGFMYNSGKNHVPPKIINKNEWQAWLTEKHK